MKRAVLIIHGFAGGTYDEEKISTFLILKGYTVFNFTLPGHERALFNKATKEEWINACEDMIKLLIKNNYRYIIVIGHSMGGILATYLASKYKEVKKLILAAPAFKYMTFGKEEFSLGNALLHTPKLIKAYSKEELLTRLVHFPTSTIKEFMSLVEDMKDIPRKVTCPTLIIHGELDDIVPISSSRDIYYLFDTKKKKLIEYKDVNHDIFRSDKIDIICNDIYKFIKGKLWFGIK